MEADKKTAKQLKADLFHCEHVRLSGGKSIKISLIQAAGMCSREAGLIKTWSRNTLRLFETKGVLCGFLKFCSNFLKKESHKANLLKTSKGFQMPGFCKIEDGTTDHKLFGCQFLTRVIFIRRRNDVVKTAHRNLYKRSLMSKKERERNKSSNWNRRSNR